MTTAQAAATPRPTADDLLSRTLHMFADAVKKAIGVEVELTMRGPDHYTIHGAPSAVAQAVPWLCDNLGWTHDDTAEEDGVRYAYCSAVDVSDARTEGDPDYDDGRSVGIDAAGGRYCMGCSRKPDSAVDCTVIGDGPLEVCHGCETLIGGRFGRPQLKK